MGLVSIGVEVQRNTDGDTPSTCLDEIVNKSLLECANRYILKAKGNLTLFIYIYTNFD